VIFRVLITLNVTLYVISARWWLCDQNTVCRSFDYRPITNVIMFAWQYMSVVCELSTNRTQSYKIKFTVYHLRPCQFSPWSAGFPQRRYLLNARVFYCVIHGRRAATGASFSPSLIVFPSLIINATLLHTHL
jgi:hypothetical protein